MDYHKLSKEQLLQNLSNPPNTPVWVNSQVELQRRREEPLVRWTRVLAVSIIILALSTIVHIVVNVMAYFRGRP